MLKEEGKVKKGKETLIQGLFFYFSVSLKTFWAFSFLQEKQWWKILGIYSSAVFLFLAAYAFTNIPLRLIVKHGKQQTQMLTWIYSTPF